METLNDALNQCIDAAGGAKKVGALLWPEKAPESAHRSLLDCMNEDRPAKLSPEQVLFVLRLARAAGFHGGMNFIAADLGYGTPVPVEPQDELGEMMRSFRETVALQATLTARIEKAAGRLALRAA